MSKFLNLGLSLDQVIEMTTVNPAQAIGEEGRHGDLKVGMPADITILEAVKGIFLFSDGKEARICVEPFCWSQGWSSNQGNEAGLLPLPYSPLFSK
jgi:predicted amidohydrolase